MFIVPRMDEFVNSFRGGGLPISAGGRPFCFGVLRGVEAPPPTAAWGYRLREGRPLPYVYWVLEHSRRGDSRFSRKNRDPTDAVKSRA